MARGAIQLSHQLPVHRSCGLQGLGEFTSVCLKPVDVLALKMIFGLEFRGALLQLVEGRCQGQTACDVGLSAEVTSQTVAESGDLLGEAAEVFFGVGQLDSQAGFGDEGPSRKLPGPVLAGLVLPVPGGGDPPCQISVGVKERQRTPPPPHRGDRRSPPPSGSSPRR